MIGGARSRLADPRAWMMSETGCGSTTGLSTLPKLPIGPGVVAVWMAPIEMATRAIAATIRQRGLGRWPLG